ncbi:MAG: glycosyltransferase [Patescibacteria group bacterium]|jgi:hypothetical protein
MTALTIAIPTYNNPQQLNLCLSTLFCCAPGDYKVLLVNNGDGDLSFPLPEVADGRVTVLKPEKNLGWCGGINAALRETDTEFFCMMNDDVVFLEGLPLFWAHLLKPFYENPQVGATGPASNFVASRQSIFFSPKAFNFHTSLLIGFCLLTRTELFRSLGGCDESLIGGDDYDLSIRLRLAGYKLEVVRESFLFHIGQQTGVRVVGKNYDSEWFQECVNNEIARKHGVVQWHDTFTQQVWYPETSEASL